MALCQSGSSQWTGTCHLCLGIFKKAWEQLAPGDRRRLVRMHKRRDKRGTYKVKCEVCSEEESRGVRSRE